MNHLTLHAYEEDGELFVWRCGVCGSTGEAGSACLHEPPMADPRSGWVDREQVRVPGVVEEPRYTLEQVEDGLLSDGALDAVAMVLDEEFARETGGEAVTDFALAKRLVTAVLDHFTQQPAGVGAEGCERCKGTGHNWEPGPTGEPISTGPCPDCDAVSSDSDGNQQPLAQLYAFCEKQIGELAHFGLLDSDHRG